MRGLRIDEQLPECFRLPLNRLAERFKGARVGVLGGELPKLLKSIDQLKRVLANVVQLGPQPVKLGRLRIVEHQPSQKIVPAIEEGESDYFVHRDDLRVT